MFLIIVGKKAVDVGKTFLEIIDYYCVSHIHTAMRKRFKGV